MNLSDSLNEVLVRCFQRAKSDHVEYLTLEYLLWALLQDELIAEYFEIFELDLDATRADVQQLIKEERADIRLSASQQSKEPMPTLGFNRVLTRALDNATKRNTVTVDVVHMFAALIAENDSDAAYILKKHGVSGTDFNDFIDEDSDLEIRGEERTEAPKEERYTINLNTEAAEGRIDPMIGRNEELERVMQVLGRRRKNNPLLIGEAGVGKTAIAEGLAWKIVNKEVPDSLKDFEVHALDLGSMLAGTRYRGDFEERLKKLISEFEKNPKSILFLDEIHQMLGAGSSSEGGAADAATLLKPALAKGSLRVIGATTYDEVRKIMSHDKALMRRFQKIDVTEPSDKETIKILEGLREKFEKYHGVSYEQEAITAAVELSSRYITDRHQPDKAIDVIDEAGSVRKLHPASNNVITKADIETIVSKIARIPPQAVSTDDKNRLRNLELTLKSVVFGQDEAIELLSDAIKLSRSGLGKADRPIGSFLFSGPTGVGKTELARQLASGLGIELIRFDMSEYMERHAVSRLIGAPPGYVGFDQGGLLTEAVNKNPHAVLLLDEIEKAHPDIFNILLQVMDYGCLTDNNGRKADFRNIIIVMTTNAGAQNLDRTSIGFLETSKQGDEQAEIKRTFTPEFRNRLDAIVSFKALGRDEISRVVDKFLAEIEGQLALKQVEAEFSDRLKNYLAEKGFDPRMGARPMSRLIQNTVRKALADELLFGKLVNGGSVSLDIDENGKVLLTIKPKRVRRPRKLKLAPASAAK